MHTVRANTDCQHEGCAPTRYREVVLTLSKCDLLSQECRSSVGHEGCAPTRYREVVLTLSKCDLLSQGCRSTVGHSQNHRAVAGGCAASVSPLVFPYERVV